MVSEISLPLNMPSQCSQILSEPIWAKGYMTGAESLELRKGFDTVYHAKILSKLPIYGIKRKEIYCLKVIYSIQSILYHIMEPAQKVK